MRKEVGETVKSGYKSNIVRWKVCIVEAEQVSLIGSKTDGMGLAKEQWA